MTRARIAWCGGPFQLNLSQRGRLFGHGTAIHRRLQDDVSG